MVTRMVNVGFCLFAAALIGSGCATVQSATPSLAMDPVMQHPGEVISPHQVVVLADASGSMGSGAFPVAKASILSFVGAMPSGEYGAAIDSFGDTDQDVWVWNKLDWFERARQLAQADSLEHIGGLTTLSSALIRLQGDLGGRVRNGALIIYSDGRVRNPQATVDAAKDLIRLHGGRLCIYTVQLGQNAQGKETLEAIAQASGCGAYYHIDDISTEAGMEAFVRRVFFEGAPRLDSDGDGVYDDEDECPNTPKGAKVDARGCWVIAGLHFDTDKSDIKPEFNGLLDEVAEVLKQNPGVRVRVDGHTDSDGTDAYNQSLSERRAAAVRAALEARGVGASIAAVQGFGESQPAVPNSSPANKYQNRRVELTVVD